MDDVLKAIGELKNGLVALSKCLETRLDAMLPDEWLEKACTGCNAGQTPFETLQVVRQAGLGGTDERWRALVDELGKAIGGLSGVLAGLEGYVKSSRDNVLLERALVELADPKQHEELRDKVTEAINVLLEPLKMHNRAIRSETAKALMTDDAPQIREEFDVLVKEVYERMSTSNLVIVPGGKA